MVFPARVYFRGFSILSSNEIYVKKPQQIQADITITFLYTMCSLVPDGGGV